MGKMGTVNALQTPTIEHFILKFQVAHQMHPFSQSLSPIHIHAGQWEVAAIYLILMVAAGSHLIHGSGCRLSVGCRGMNGDRNTTEGGVGRRHRMGLGKHGESAYTRLMKTKLQGNNRMIEQGTLAPKEAAVREPRTPPLPAPMTKRS